MRKTTNTIRILPLLLCLLLGLAQPAAALLKKGEPLPEVTGEDIAGEDFSTEQLKGRPFIMKIGTTWCGTCGDQSRQINDLRDFLSEKEILFVDVFIQQSAKKARSYFEKRGYQLPDITVIDSGQLSRRLNVYVIPRLLLVDKDMRIYRDGANMTSAALKRALKKMLAETN